MIALGIADAFSNAGARVVTARSFANALIAVEDEIPSAVILDHALSDGESSHFCQYLKQQNIPYVVHSGYPAQEHGDAENAINVPKPASPQLLITTVEGLLRSRKFANCGYVA